MQITDPDRCVSKRTRHLAKPASSWAGGQRRLGGGRTGLLGLVTTVVAALLLVGCPVDLVTRDASLHGRTGAPLRLTWNSWQETSGGISYTPAKSVQADAPGLLLAVQLSGISFAGVAGATSLNATTDFQRFIAEQILSHARKIELHALVVPDPKFFAAVTKPLVHFEIDVQKIVDFTKSRYELPSGKSPFDVLRDTERPGDAPFSFGEFATVLKPKGTAGRTTIAISIWDVYDRPIEELLIPVCLAAPGASCDNQDTSVSMIKGVDSLKFDPTGAPAEPDAAAHFIAIGNNDDQVRGILHFKGEPLDKSRIWTLESSLGALRDKLEKPILSSFAADIPDPVLFARTGESLFNALFPNESPAAKAMTDFIRSATAATPWAPDAKSFYVRMIPLGADPPLVLPLALLAIPEKDGSDKSRFLGDSVRVETPLPRVYFRVGTDCICQWRALLPCPTSEANLEEAWKELMTHTTSSKLVRDWKERVASACGQPVPSRTCGRSAPPASNQVNCKIDEFRNWLRTPTPAGKAVPSKIVMTLSHQKAGELSIKPDDAIKISETDIRQTVAPSVALLVGCQTGSPAALSIVRRLNYAGYAAAITTAATVSSYLAGDYIGCFAKAIEAAEPKKNTLGEVHLRAVQCLMGESPSKGGRPYGEQARVFQLVGNPAIRVCAPEKCQ